MPDVFVETIGETVSYPDDWSDQRISEHALATFKPKQGPIERTVRNLAGSIVDSAAAIPETVAIIAGKLSSIPALGEDRPQSELPTQKAADWMRYQAQKLYPDKITRPEGVEGFLTETLPQGAGSMATILAGGAAARMLKIPAMVSTAALGAATTGANAFRDAIASGADNETAFRTFFINAGIGTSEAFPIAKWLSGNPAANKLKAALVDGSEELIQSAFSDIASNIAAQNLYDPERPWNQGVAEDAAAGFTLGTMFSLAVSAVSGKKIAVKTAQEQAREASAPLTADVLDIIPETPKVIQDQMNAEAALEQPKAPAAEEPAPAVETLTPAEAAVVEVQTMPEAVATESQIVDVKTGLTFEGNPITSKTRAEVRRAADVINEVNNQLGFVIDRIVIQDLDETSAGIASAPRAGSFSTVVIDPMRLADSVSNGLDLKEAVHQEVIHNLDGLAVQREWEAQGKQGDFRSFWDQHHQAIAAEMTPDEKAMTEKLYGAKIKSDVHMAAEFVQLLLRGEFQGVDAKPNNALTRLLSWIKNFWGGFTGNDTNAEVSRAAKDHVSKIEAILNSRNLPRPSGQGEVVAVGASVSPDAAGVEGPGAQQPAEPGAGTQGTGGVEGSSGNANDVGGSLGAGLPGEWTVAAYRQVQKVVENLQGVTDTEKDLITTHALDEVFKRAAEYSAANDGNMEGFATARVAQQQAINGLKAERAKKRSPEGGSVSLDAPLAPGADQTIGETVAAQSDAVTATDDALSAAKRLMAQLPEASRKLLEMVETGKRGWMAKLAAEEGVTQAAISSRVETARKQLARLMMTDPVAREAMADMGYDPDDLINAAPPIKPEDMMGPAKKARDLSPSQKLVRFFRPSTWGIPGYLRDVATKTEDAEAAGLLEDLADAVEGFYDYKASLIGAVQSHFFKTTGGLDVATLSKVKDEVELWASTAQARDNNQTMQAAWQNAEQVIPTLSKEAQQIIADIKRHGQSSGVLMKRLNVHVQAADGGWRPLINLGEMWWPRRISDRVNEILGDPDHHKKTGEYWKLVGELMAHDPMRFDTVEATDHYLTQRVVGTMGNGDFFAGAEMARGEKLPDSWYDYTLDGYLLNMESWANRVAQIAAFGQSRPGNLDLFDQVNKFASRQSKTFGSEQDSLKKRIAIFKDEVTDSHQLLWNDKLGKVITSIAAVRYLSSTLTMVRNVSQSAAAIGENLGWINSFKATTNGMYDAARAIGASVKAGRLIEPAIVTQAAAAGAVQRSLYFSRVFGVDVPGDTKSGKVFRALMMPNQLAEMLTRSVSHQAAMLWLKDAADEFRANPMSKASLRMQAQMQRWGLNRAQRIAAMNGDAVQANRLFRAATKEKLYGYQPDQVPLIFRSRYGKLLLQFQSWGAQRSRDIAKNLIGPMWDGEVVDGVRVRNPWPALRFILGVMAGTVLVNGIKEAIFDRRLRDTAWEEIFNAMSEDERLSAKLAMDRIFTDLTATGAAGILPDYLRILKDSLTPGRQKSFVNAPGLQLAADITALLKDQIERDVDPSAMLRDIRDRLLRTTPLVKEIEDVSLGLLLSNTDAGQVRAARQDISVARAKLRAWAKETGRDDQAKRRGAQASKTPNSETYDQLQEALLIGDVQEAGKIINEFTNYRSDRTKLNAVKSSMRSRHPIQLNGYDKADVAEFMAWLKRRNPAEFDRASALVQRFEKTKALVGL